MLLIVAQSSHNTIRNRLDDGICNASNLIAADRIADSVDPDQVQSDLGLHYLFKPICLNINT